MRIAFITPEYPTKNKKSGGLASYLGRIVKELQKQGHTISVFVLDIAASEETSFTENGVRIHYIPLSKQSFIRTALLYGRAFWKKIGGIPEGPFFYLLSGYALAKAAREAHKKEPFAIIHSSNLETTALFLPKQLRGGNVVRVSSKRSVWAREDGLWGPRAWMVSKIEEYMVKRAPKVYAPSVFLKDIYTHAGADIVVIRPPLETCIPEGDNLTPPDVSVPSKYFLHVAGQFGRRKGTDILLDAMSIAQERFSDIAVVFVGRGDIPEKYREHPHVYVLGSQPRPVVHWLFARALATIVPSRIENLPNTAIESVMHHTPVIGTNGASIDEFITPDKNGILVAKGDPEALAHAMVDVWENGLTFVETQDGILSEMGPETVVKKLIAFAAGKK